MPHRQTGGVSGTGIADTPGVMPPPAHRAERGRRLLMEGGAEPVHGPPMIQAGKVRHAVREQAKGMGTGRLPV